MPRDAYSRRIGNIRMPSSRIDDLSTRRFAESQFMSRPELSQGWDYEQLEERYPMATIKVRQQRMEDARLREEDLAYKTGIIKEREAELGLKKAARDLDMYEAQINREDAMLEQIPVARQKLSELDVRDPDFINKAYDIQEQHPLAFESDKFQKYIFQPMLNRNSRLSGRRQEGIITQAEAKQAMDEIMKYETLKENTYPNEEHPEQLRKYLGIQQNRLNQFYSQRGMDNPMGVAAPQQGGIAPQPALAPSPSRNISPKAQEALQWLEQNPTHPSAEGVRAKLQRQGIL